MGGATPDGTMAQANFSTIFSIIVTANRPSRLVGGEGDREGVCQDRPGYEENNTHARPGVIRSLRKGRETP